MASKNFKDDEIKGYIDVNGRKVVELKMGVQRKYHKEYTSYNDCRQLDQYIIFLERYEEMIKKLYGGDDFSDPYSS